MRLPQISVLWLKLFYRKRRDESALCITNTGYDLCAKTAPNNFPGGKNPVLPASLQASMSFKVSSNSHC